MKKYDSKDQPVIIQNLLDDWPAKDKERFFIINPINFLKKSKKIS